MRSIFGFVCRSKRLVAACRLHRSTSSSQSTRSSQTAVSFVALGCLFSKAAQPTVDENQPNQPPRSQQLLVETTPSNPAMGQDISQPSPQHNNQPVAAPLKQVTDNHPVAQPIRQPSAELNQPLAQPINRQPSIPAQSSSFQFPFGTLPGLAQQTIEALLHGGVESPTIHQPSQSQEMPHLKVPVVLVHGFLGYGSLWVNPITDKPVFEYFGKVRQMYEDAGYTVIVPVLPRSDKIEKRAKALQVALGLVETHASTVSTDANQVTQLMTPVEKDDQKEIQHIKEDASKLPHAQPSSTKVATGTESPSIHVISTRRMDLGTYRGPFHLVAHSMGGLDSRHTISHLQPDGESQNRILSLTTIATPHRGSPLADIIVQQVQSNYVVPPFPLGTNDPILEGVKVEQLVGAMEKILHTDFSGMLDLTTTATASFNKDTPDRAGTHYFSYAGYRNFDPFSIFFMPSKLIQPREGPNDGLVSVESAKWGQFMGTVALDHAQQVGNLDLGLPYNGHLPLYREIAFSLAKVEAKYGEAQESLTRARERKGSLTEGESRSLKQKERRASDQREHKRDDIAQQAGREVKN